MHYSKCFNYNYTEFFGYDTRDKSICTSSEGCRNTNTISKQGIPKINMNMASPSAMLVFGCSPHNDTSDFLS